MSFLAIAAVVSVVLTAITALSALAANALRSNPFLPPSDAALVTVGTLTLLTGASYVTTAIGAAVRYL